MSGTRRIGRLGALALGLTLLASGPAAAHDDLDQSTPAADTTVAAMPSELDLEFTATPRAVSVTMLDPAGRPVPLSQPARSGSTATVALPDAAFATGGYTVSWRIVSSDGHPVGGSYGFILDPTAPPSTSSEGSVPAWVAPAGLGVLVLTGGGVWLRRRRPRGITVFGVSSELGTHPITGRPHLSVALPDAPMTDLRNGDDPCSSPS
ncbi:copper resistance protein CopC [Nocardioides sp.]|uniref:copper resistance protein CopC n=1 Tax=Nocardioides sp. TaxID=35761 RepID=UPI003518FD74